MENRGKDEDRARWDTAAVLVRAAQDGDAPAMDELLTLESPYATRLSGRAVPRRARVAGSGVGVSAKGSLLSVPGPRVAGRRS